MATARVNAQGISRFLRKRGFNPASTETLRRSPALQCKRSLDDVIIKVWSDPYTLEPSADDIEVAAEIAQLLTDNDYTVRYEAGSYRMTITGREVNTVKTQAEVGLAQEAGLLDSPPAPNQQDDQARLDKLPKWAREEIVCLRAKVDRLNALISAGPADSNAFLRPYSDAPTPLGKNPVIQFRTGHGELEGFTVWFKNDELLIQGMPPVHDDYLGVFPASGNCIAIKHVKKGS